MSAARHRHVGVISTMALVIALVGVAPAWAAEPLVLDQDQILQGEEGSTAPLADITVDEQRVGSVCTLRVHAENQFSVHPGNDLVVTTGGTETVIEDVEAEPDADRELSAGIVLGTDLVVELRFGPHQVSSMGFDLSVECPTTAPIVVEADPCVDAANAGSSACSDPSRAPLLEVSVPPVEVPDPCSTGLNETRDSLTVASEGCDESATTTPGVPVTTLTPTTAATSPPPPAVAAAQSTTTTTTNKAPTPQSGNGTGPTVLGLQISRLPQTPAAAPVEGAPAYTG